MSAIASKIASYFLKEEEWKLEQPQTTFTGTPIQPIKKGLPKTTESLCPECLKVIPAIKEEEDGKVVMKKRCAEHGDFKDTLYSDVRFYLKMEEWVFGDYRGVMNPAIPNATRCPSQCGLCNMHTSHTGLANIDLTNRCNLTCPICFANANNAGYLYEPSLQEVRKMLKALRDMKPVNCRSVQFSGGEPTIYPHFFEALKMAKDMGFSHIQIATNGILFNDIEFAQRAKEAGLHTLYLQMDGTDDEIYRRTRGEKLWELKMRTVEVCRKVGLKIVFVPTIVKGYNDNQIGNIVKCAIDNVDVISGISFQPVAFTGRIAKKELEAKRFTLSDLARCVAEQTGLTDDLEDWFPLSCVAPFSRLISSLRGEETTQLTCHPHCSAGTYLYVDEDKNAVPITRFIDIGPMLKEMDMLSRNSLKSFSKFLTEIKALNALRKYYHPEKAPKGLTFEKFLLSLQGMVDKKVGRGELGIKTYKALLVAGMHFMDAYDYDIERVKRCVIHYAAPNGLLYPFCAYNSGIVFREKIEKKYSLPISDERKNVFGSMCRFDSIS